MGAQQGILQAQNTTVVYSGIKALQYGRILHDTSNILAVVTRSGSTPSFNYYSMSGLKLVSYNTLSGLIDVAYDSLTDKLYGVDGSQTLVSGAWTEYFTSTGWNNFEFQDNFSVVQSGWSPAMVSGDLQDGKYVFSTGDGSVSHSNTFTVSGNFQLQVDYDFVSFTGANARFILSGTDSIGSNYKIEISNQGANRKFTRVARTDIDVYIPESDLDHIGIPASQYLASGADTWYLDCVHGEEPGSSGTLFRTYVKQVSGVTENHFAYQCLIKRSLWTVSSTVLGFLGYFGCYADMQDYPATQYFRPNNFVYPHGHYNDADWYVHTGEDWKFTLFDENDVAWTSQLWFGATSTPSFSGAKNYVSPYRTPWVLASGTPWKTAVVSGGAFVGSGVELVSWAVYEPSAGGWVSSPGTIIFGYDTPADDEHIYPQTFINVPVNSGTLQIIVESGNRAWETDFIEFTIDKREALASASQSGTIFVERSGTTITTSGFSNFDIDTTVTDMRWGFGASVDHEYFTVALDYWHMWTPYTYPVVTTSSVVHPAVYASRINVRELDDDGTHQRYVFSGLPVSASGGLSIGVSDWDRRAIQIAANDDTMWLKVLDRIYAFECSGTFPTVSGLDDVIFSGSVSEVIPSYDVYSLNYHESTAGRDLLYVITDSGQNQSYIKSIDADLLIPRDRKVVIDASGVNTPPLFPHALDKPTWFWMKTISGNNCGLYQYPTDPLRPAFSAVNVDNYSLRCGTGEQANVIAEVINCWGEAISGAHVQFNVSQGDGTIAPWTTTTSGIDGEATAVYTVGDLAGLVEISVVITD